MAGEVIQTSWFDDEGISSSLGPIVNGEGDETDLSEGNGGPSEMI